MLDDAPKRFPAQNDPVNDPVKAALDQSLEKLRELLSQRIRLTMELAGVEWQLARLRPKIVGLATLSDEPPNDEYFDLFLQETAGKGLTDATRDALMADSGFMTPLQVRDALIRTGYDVTAKYANPLAVIHNILKRLVDSKRVIQRTVESKSEYKWNPDARLTKREVRLLEERQPEWWKHMKEVGTANLMARFAPPKKNFFRQMAEEIAKEDAKKKS